MCLSFFPGSLNNLHDVLLIGALVARACINVHVCVNVGIYLYDALLLFLSKGPGRQLNVNASFLVLSRASHAIHGKCRRDENGITETRVAPAFSLRLI